MHIVIIMVVIYATTVLTVLFPRTHIKPPKFRQGQFLWLSNAVVRSDCVQTSVVRVRIVTYYLVGDKYWYAVSDSPDPVKETDLFLTQEAAKRRISEILNWLS